jgi:hypothetical protein
VIVAEFMVAAPDVESVLRVVAPEIFIDIASTLSSDNGIPVCAKEVPLIVELPSTNIVPRTIMF